MKERGSMDRRRFLKASAAVITLGGGGILLSREVNSSLDPRPLEGKSREEGVFEIQIREYVDPIEGKTYEPVFRVKPSIRARELSDEELEEKGYARTGLNYGTKVYGDAGGQSEIVKTVGRPNVIETYDGWVKLKNGGYVSDNFVGYGERIDKKESVSR